MKRVNVIIVFTVLLLSGMTLSAQNVAQIGIRGGVTLSNFGGSDLKQLDDQNVLMGYMCGITLDLPIVGDLYLMSGLDLMTKGAKYIKGNENANASLTLNPLYLQLPLHLAYKLPLGESAKLVLGAGPYIAYGVSGSLKGEVDLLGYTTSTDMDFFGENGIAKNIDLGAGINVGLELGFISIALGYDLGFMNILDKNNDDLTNQFDGNSPSLRNQVAYATVGIKF